MNPFSHQMLDSKTHRPHSAQARVRDDHAQHRERPQTINICDAVETVARGLRFARCLCEIEIADGTSVLRSSLRHAQQNRRPNDVWARVRFPYSARIGPIV